MIAGAMPAAIKPCSMAVAPVDAALLRLVYSALAETYLAFGRIDFAARLRWLLYLLHPHAVAGGANNFVQNITRLFHSNQSQWAIAQQRNETRFLTKRSRNLRKHRCCRSDVLSVVKMLICKTE